MFKKKILLIGSAWIALAAGMVLFFSLVTEDHQKSYHRLMNHQASAPDTPVSSQIRQHRSNVSKHFLRTHGMERLQLHVRSSSSDLVCDQKKGKSEIIELFKGMTCLAQEELVYKLADGQEAKMQKNGRLLIQGKDPTHLDSWIDADMAYIIPQQQIRQIDAENAIYRYHSENLTADTVKIARYIAPGHRLIFNEQPASFLMNGTASQVEFSLSNNNKPFKAQQLRATFQGWEAMR